MTYAYAVEAALIDARSIVLVAGIDAEGRNILIVMDISDPANPTPIGSMKLATQGKAIADIEIQDGKTYIGFESPTSPQIEIVQIGNPAQPTSAGVVQGVGQSRAKALSQVSPAGILAIVTRKSRSDPEQFSEFSGRGGERGRR